jgi:hypothetical protein
MKIAFIFLVIASISYSQQGDGGIPKGYKIPVDIKTIGFVSFDEPNIATLKTEDEENEKMGSGPWRFGFNNPCGLSISNSGSSL